MRVIVVGAGIIGLAVADELTRRGIQVEVFEKASQVGEEASWAAAGILSPQGEARAVGSFLDLLLAGYPLILEAVGRLTAATGIDLKFRASGMLDLAFSDEDEQELEQELQWQRQAGLRWERLTGAQVKRLEPAVDGPVRWGVWWPQTSQVDPGAFVAAYAAVVQRQGVVIHTGTPALQFLVRSDQVTGIQTPQGEVQGDWVVNCAGSWSGFDASLAFEVPLEPVRGQILEFKTTGPFLRRVVKSPRAYLVQRDSRQLIAGTTLERVGFDKRVTLQGIGQIQEGIRELSSGTAGWRPVGSWAGLRPDTPDHLPILGASPLKRLLLATGHYRNGILLAPLTGRLMADWIEKGSCSIDLAAFRVERFHKEAMKQ